MRQTKFRTASYEYMALAVEEFPIVNTVTD